MASAVKAILALFSVVTNMFLQYNNHLRFDLSPERIKSLTEDIMHHTKKVWLSLLCCVITHSGKVYDEVANVPEGQHTFENTVKKIAHQEAEQSVQSANATFPLYLWCYTIITTLCL